MNRILAAAAAIGFTLALAGCTSTPAAPGTTAPATSPPMATATTPTPAAADIVDTAVAAGDFNTLAEALTAAGLVETLKGDGPFTVFAPTDDAFAKLPEGTLDALLQDQEQLTKVLTYHVVPGQVMAADVAGMDGASVNTVEGSAFTVNVDGGAVSLTDGSGNTVNVTQTDIAASNGVIHVIDAVLLPAG